MTFKRWIAAFAVVVMGFAVAPHFVHAAAYNATDVVGQLNSSDGISFTKSGQNSGPNSRGLDAPRYDALDTVHHRLFVSDANNHRILVYSLDSSNNVSSRIAAYVIGQSDFDQKAFSGAGPSTLSTGLYGLAYDPVNDRLFAVDSGDNRVLVFNVASNTIANGMSASFVLGQANFTSSAGGTTSSTLSAPIALTYDQNNSRLFVADTSNNRILVFNVASGTVSNGMPASYVLGQSLFTTSNSAISQTGISSGNGYGLAYDSVNDRLFFSDTTANRVLVFNVASGTIANGEAASFVLGQTGFGTGTTGTSSSTFSGPYDLAYDSTNGRLFASDFANGRVLIFNVASGTVSNGKAASFVLGQTDFISSTRTTVSSSTTNGIFGQVYDATTGNLFAVDSGNDRVLVWSVASGTVSNGKAAYDALGQLDANDNPLFTKSALNNGLGIRGIASGFDQTYEAIDPIHHHLFVGDPLNNRVLVFNLDSSNNLVDHLADYVLGQPGFYSGIASTTQVYMSFPTALTYDSANNRLFVSDTGNGRVLVFDMSALASGMNASYVIGRPNFTDHTSGLTSSTIADTEGLAYDYVNNRLFGADETNNRILVWNVAPANMANGMPASFVLGQSVFTTASTSVSSSTFAFSRDLTGIAYDNVNSRLFVTDDSGNRVMVWSVPAGGVTNGMPASYVLGQTTFDTHTSGTSSSTLNYPEGITYDASSTRLFVQDDSNNRVVMYDLSNGITNGMAATFVIGQPDFTSSGSGVSQTALNSPWGMGDFDTGNRRLFVGDAGNNRVMIYDLLKLSAGTAPVNATVGSSYSATGLCTTANGQGTVSCGISGTLPAGLTFDPTSGTLSGTPTAKGSYSFSVIASDTVSGIGSLSDRISYALAVQGALPDNTIVASYGAGGGGGGGSSGSPVVTPPTPTPSSTPANPSSTPSAPSTPEASALEAQIQVLLTKIAELKAQLGIPTGTGAGSGTPTPGLTLQFTRNLTLGSTGDDVKALQQLLADQASGTAAAALKAHGTTHLFGPLTKAALAEWQKAHNISPASGFFGPLTRAAVNGAAGR